MLQRLNAWGAAMLMSVLLAPLSALADVPAGVETVFTTAAADFTTVVGYGWTLFLVIVGGLIVFSIVKRVISRAVGR